MTVYFRKNQQKMGLPKKIEKTREVNNVKHACKYAYNLVSYR